MEFDTFFEEILEESKYLFEQAKLQDACKRKIYLHSSLLMIMSSLEACLNAIADELLIEPYKDCYSLLEQSMLMEKEVVFEKGLYKLGPNLKMSRTIDKLELLFVKFLKEKWDPTVTWFIQLKQAIQTRNNLVHPKTVITITDNQVELAIKAVLDTINELYKAIYKKPFPAYSRGLSSRL